MSKFDQELNETGRAKVSKHVNLFTESDAEYKNVDSLNIDKCSISIDGDRNLLSISKAEAIFQAWLAKGKVVYGQLSVQYHVWNTRKPEWHDTHIGILVCIEPLEKDSAERVLKDLVEWEAQNGIPPHDSQAITIPLEYFERACKLLEGK